MHFKNRKEAGRAVGERLKKYAHRPETIVLALPRGGVPVGVEVAGRLGCPLDAFVVRKLAVPRSDEIAFGALTSGGTQILNDELIRDLALEQATIDRIVAREQRELDRRERLYRGTEAFPNLAQFTVIVVDDGLASGATMLAAALALHQLGVQKLVIAVPVARPKAATRWLGMPMSSCVCGRRCRFGPWAFGTRNTNT